MRVVLPLGGGDHIDDVCFAPSARKSRSVTGLMLRMAYMYDGLGMSCSSRSVNSRSGSLVGETLSSVEGVHVVVDLSDFGT